MNEINSDKLNRLLNMYNETEEIFVKSSALRKKLGFVVMGFSILTTGSLWLLISKALPQGTLWGGAVLSTLTTLITLYINNFNVEQTPKEARRTFRELGKFIARSRSSDVSDEEYWRKTKDFEYRISLLRRRDFEQH